MSIQLQANCVPSTAQKRPEEKECGKAQLERQELELVRITLQLHEKETKDLADPNRKKDTEAKGIAEHSYFATVLAL